MVRRHVAAALAFVRTAALACLVVLVCLAASACSATSIREEEPGEPVGQIMPARLAIIHTGCLQGTYAGGGDRLSLADIAGLRSGLMSEGYDVLLLGSGNALGGSLLADLSYGETAIGILNAAHYDALALGSRELALGSQTLLDRMNQADPTFLSANVFTTSLNAPIALANTTFPLSDGRLIGIFGLTDPVSSGTLSPLTLDGLEVLDANLTDLAQQQVADLRSKGCRLVVCLANLGEARDGGYAAQQLASQVSGIDILLDTTSMGSHQDAITDASGDQVLAVWTGERLADATLVTWQHGTLAAQHMDPDGPHIADEQVDALVTQSELEQGLQVNVPVATSSKQLAADGSSSGETALGDLLADATLWQAKRGDARQASAAIIDGSLVVGPLPKGSISRADALDTCEHAQTRLCSLEVSGAQLLAGMTALFDGDGAITEAFPQVAGLEMTVDPSKDAASRVHIVTVGGKAFAKDATYTIVTCACMDSEDSPYHTLLAPAEGQATLFDESASTALAAYLDKEQKGDLAKAYDKPQDRIAILQAKKGDEKK